MDPGPSLHLSATWTRNTPGRWGHLLVCPSPAPARGRRGRGTRSAPRPGTARDRGGVVLPHSARRPSRSAELTGTVVVPDPRSRNGRVAGHVDDGVGRWHRAGGRGYAGGSSQAGGDDEGDADDPLHEATPEGQAPAGPDAAVTPGRRTDGRRPRPKGRWRTTIQPPRWTEGGLVRPERGSGIRPIGVRTGGDGGVQGQAGLLDGRYRLLGRLGSGGMGTAKPRPRRASRPRRRDQGAPRRRPRAPARGCSPRPGSPELSTTPASSASSTTARRGRRTAPRRTSSCSSTAACSSDVRRAGTSGWYSGREHRRRSALAGLTTGRGRPPRPSPERLPLPPTRAWELGPRRGPPGTPPTR